MPETTKRTESSEMRYLVVPETTKRAGSSEMRYLVVPETTKRSGSSEMGIQMCQKQLNVPDRAEQNLLAVETY
ncbi:hypothetical protein ACFQZE_09440 [Paenibacillus sp. GCM10027627]